MQRKMIFTFFVYMFLCFEFSAQGASDEVVKTTSISPLQALCLEITENNECSQLEIAKKSSSLFAMLVNGIERLDFNVSDESLCQAVRRIHTLYGAGKSDNSFLQLLRMYRAAASFKEKYLHDFIPFCVDTQLDMIPTSIIIEETFFRDPKRAMIAFRLQYQYPKLVIAPFSPAVSKIPPSSTELCKPYIDLLAQHLIDFAQEPEIEF